MAYSKIVLEYNKKLDNVGKLDENQVNVGTGWVGSPACGDVMRLQFAIGENGEINQVKFKTYGCGSAIASSALVSELLMGKTIEGALNIKNNFIADTLNLPPIKRHCSLLAEDAIKMAVDNYKNKQKNIGVQDAS